MIGHLNWKVPILTGYPATRLIWEVVVAWISYSELLNSLRL